LTTPDPCTLLADVPTPTIEELCEQLFNVLCFLKGTPPEHTPPADEPEHTPPADELTLEKLWDELEDFFP